MNSIATKFLGPTNSRGARIKATTGSGRSLTIPYDYELGDKSHSKAALELARKFGWSGSLIEGHTEHGNVYVFSTGETFQI